MPGTNPPSQQLRILCFGNSLTGGYPYDRPYAGRMATVIEDAMPGRNVYYDVNGMPGDLVTRGRFRGRMEESLEETRRPYDWVVILGGTNDIGWGTKAEDLIESLKSIWDMPLSKGSKVLALTIPETMRKFPSIIERRDQVNESIKAYKKTNFFHFDLNKAVTYHSMSPEDQQKYWDPDGVHLTGAGYDLMGEKIGEALVRILRLAEAQETDMLIGTDARQRKAIEELIFEEERGDPRLLSQGYIVVRKKDLD
ncbi:SGNH hydrolase-type esterase domain-containing protein [Xylariaceae sp. FL0255]|nr:SGNH hydrolase-type esterase domain-containing protein [Xylariaceae sp. FL0255]